MITVLFLHKRNIANRVNIIFYFKNGIKYDIGKKKEMRV